MNVDINKNPAWFRSLPQCRYSNLPVSHPEMFISRHPGTNYFVEIAKLGDQIVLVKASGYVRSYEMTEALRFMDEYLSKYFDQENGIIYLEDYVDVEGADAKARKEYIDHFLNMRNVIIAAIMYNQSILFKISFKITKRIYGLTDQIFDVNGYDQAIVLALKIYDQRYTGHTLQHDKDSGGQSLPVERSEACETIFRRAAGIFYNFKDKLFSRNNEEITRQYSEALLKYIESIDWQKDGFKAPEIIYPADKSARKVFETISFIKSEIDDLLKERNASEKVLQESEARYRHLVEHAQTGILEFDYQTNRIIGVNDSLLNISGYTKDEVFSINPMDLMTEESKKIYVKRFSQRLSGEIVSPDSTYQFITKSGQKKWVLLNTNINYKAGQLHKADVVVTDITRLKEVENKLVSHQSKLKQLSIELSKSEESQRRQLASRLHESVSQELFVAQLKLNTLEKSLDAPELSRQLDRIKEQIVKSIREIKDVTYDLSPSVLYDLGLKEAVESLSKSIEAKYRLAVKARFSGSLDHIDEEIKLIIYRIIKEIIHNSIKYARASFINIIIDNTNNSLKVDVSDNGVGFDTGSLSKGHHTGGGFGLFDIRGKINHLGGHLTINSTPGSGTRIGLVVPLNDLKSETATEHSARPVRL